MWTRMYCIGAALLVAALAILGIGGKAIIETATEACPTPSPCGVAEGLPPSWAPDAPEQQVIETLLPRSPLTSAMDTSFPTSVNPAMIVGRPVGEEMEQVQPLLRASMKPLSLEARPRNSVIVQPIGPVLLPTSVLR
jgi:hypothetical protein